MAGDRVASDNVSRRGALRADFRHPALLVVEAGAADLPGNGYARIHLCVRGCQRGRRVLDTLILPQVNSDCMQIFIDEVSRRHPGDRIVMVLDGAGWHKGGDVVVPTT